MTDLRRAAEQALETLERLDKWLDFRYGKELLPPEREVVEALRTALAQPEQKHVGYVTDSGMSAVFISGINLDDDTPLYAAPPHYWGNVTSAELVEELRRRDMLMVPIKKQEPVAWIKKDRSSIEVSIMSAEYMKNEGFEPLYLTPPISDYHEGWEEGFKAGKRDTESSIPEGRRPEWVGLTYEEIYEHEWWDEETAFAVNKELREKNT